MVRRTFKDVKENLRKIASSSGLPADDRRLVEIVNLVQENLLSRAKTIVGTQHRLKFLQYDRVIALPARYDRAVSITIDRDSAPVMNHWYEFLDFGPGPIDRHSHLGAVVDRGDSPVVHTTLPKPAIVRVRAYEDERISGVRPKIKILGYDEYGRWVRSEVDGVFQDGELIEINGDAAANYADGVVKFSKITSVVKPETKGTVELYLLDPEFPVDEVFAARYEHWETNPSYRLYEAPGADGATIHCLANVRWRPVTGDNDLLIVSSLPALRHGVRAVAKEDDDDVEGAFASWGLAEKALADEALRYYGRSKIGVDVTHAAGGFGLIPDIQ